MSERMKMMGRRAELRERLKSLNLEADALRGELREALDPICDPVALEPDKIASLAVSLSVKIGEIQEATAKMNMLNEYLGG